MKIKRLRLAGFGPFKTEQVVDFERFDSDGIFLITGKTGAGKSSILDAICFALYGQVPRFSGTEQQLRSDHCAPNEPSYVELEFSVNEHDYRLFRSPQYERAKKNGSGLTVAAPTATLQVRDGADWRGIAAKPGAVGQELAVILPLKQDQFLQVILLAQNRFQRFLLAKTEERRVVLRTLCGTSRFEQLETSLILRRKALDDELGAVRHDITDRATAARHLLRRETTDLLAVSPDADAGAGADADLNWFSGALAGLEASLARAVSLAQDAEVVLGRALADERAAAETERRQGRRRDAATSLAELETRSPQIEAEREVLRRAARSARVWSTVLTARSTAASLSAAVTAEAEARARWQEQGHAPADVLSSATLQPVLDDLVGTLGALESVLDDERRLPDLDVRIAGGAADLAVLTTALEQAEKRSHELPQQIDTLADDHAAVSLVAAGARDAAQSLLRAQAALDAACEAGDREAEHARAGTVLLTRSQQNAAAAARYEALLSRRFAGHAQELAGLLRDGVPCDVCGATEHPRPAVAEGALVSEKDLEDARSSMAVAQQELDDAHELVKACASRLAEARGRASNQTVAQLTETVVTVQTRVQQLREATSRVGGLAERLQGLRAELSRVQICVDGCRADRDAARAGYSEVIALRNLLAQRVDAQRGRFESIASQVDELQSELRAARVLHTALILSRERTAAHDEATTRLAAQTWQEGFLGEVDVVDARVDDDEVARMDARIRAYDDQAAAARAAAADPELIGVPLEPIDRQPAVEALEVAGAARDAALADRSSLAERVDQLRVLVSEVSRQFAESASLIARHSQVRQLADVVHGDEPNTKRMRLETYVLAAQLEEIVAAANGRLRTMTSGRYTLEHDDSAEFRGGQSGLGLAIRDEHTGRARATNSLSGGETFLASLSLALGLAEVVTGQVGGITLDTLFVDEGFGSLDSETLETAMGTLDALRAGGRTVGLISHVESMKEQISATLDVVISDGGDSRISQPE